MFWLGTIIGFIVCAFVFGWDSLNKEKTAIKNGYIKLQDSFYKLQKIELEELKK